MSELSTAIPIIRESIAAILRLHIVKPATGKKGKARPASIGAVLAGRNVSMILRHPGPEITVAPVRSEPPLDGVKRGQTLFYVIEIIE